MTDDFNRHTLTIFQQKKIMNVYNQRARQSVNSTNEIKIK